MDLEKVYKIGRMTIEWVAEFGRIFDIQTSLDGKNWTTVYRQLHGIGEKEEIHMYQNARYVRMKGYAMGRGSGYTVKELQIFEWQKGDPTVNPVVEALPEKKVVEVGEGSYVVDNMNLRQPREPYYVTENIHAPIVSKDGESVIADHIGVVAGNLTKGAPDLNDRTDKKQEHSFGIYVPEGTCFTRIGSKLKIQLGNHENYMTIGTLDQGIDLEYLYPYAYSYATGTMAEYSYNEMTAMVTTDYRCETEQKRTGDGIKMKR